MKCTRESFLSKSFPLFRQHQFILCIIKQWHADATQQDFLKREKQTGRKSKANLCWRDCKSWHPKNFLCVLPRRVLHFRFQPQFWHEDICLHKLCAIEKVRWSAAHKFVPQLFSMTNLWPAENQDLTSAEYSCRVYCAIKITTDGRDEASVSRKPELV